ncbi:hypothetical protein BVG19_g5422 [[Candida] boidinii]|nr:hypothetical protein BVG19_g5422 [[Candida] boidinii]OWB48541.1 hypothetical protein B5S27_g76 [[Candida] boidinii]
MFGITCKYRLRIGSVIRTPFWNTNSVFFSTKTSWSVTSVIDPPFENTQIKDKISLREYQQECIDACVSSIRNGVSRIAVNIGTGGGKTVIFSNLIPDLPTNPVSNGNRVLILVHRKELADQAVNTIQRTNPDLKVEMDMAKFKPTHNDTDVIVASVPSLARGTERLEKYNPDDYKAIIIDECHHSVSNSYHKILNYFKADSSETNISVIGFSATLERHDKKPLRKVFDKIVFDKGLKDLISDGYLANFSWARVSVSFKLDEVELNSSKSDYLLESLAKHVNTADINELAFKTYLKFKDEKSYKSTLFFCVNVQHMVDLSYLFRMNGVNAQYVTGNTTKLEREKILNDFKKGLIPVLFNCGVFTEGTDIPNIDSIFMLRPTKSKPLLIQMLGRGLRLHHEKEKCFIVDFVDASETGIQLDPSLKGTDNSALNGLFPNENAVSKAPDPDTSGEIDYIEISNFEGFEELMNRADSKLSDTGKSDYKLYMEDNLSWVQLKRDSWGVSITPTQYYKIEKEKDYNISVLSFVTVVRNGEMRFTKKREIESSDQILDLLELCKLDLMKDDYKKDMYFSSQYRGEITSKQLEFLTKIFSKVAKKSNKINQDQFNKDIKTIIKSMNKKTASNLIFAYSVAGQAPIKLYIRNILLRKKDAQKSLLVDSIHG